MSVSTTPLPFEQPAPDSPQERKRREEKVRALLGQAEDEAISRGVFGAPAFLVQKNGGDELFWGNDRLHFLEQALR